MVSGRDPQEAGLGPADVYLGLGANLGDRRETIWRALSALTEKGILVVETSSLYETEPVDVEDQPWFLNLVARATTRATPHDVLASCKRIESELGRCPAIRFGPRAIDIDLLLYDRLVMEDESLCIPHPRMRERRFVLVPLVSVSPELTDPRDGVLYSEVLRELDEGKKVTISLLNES